MRDYVVLYINGTRHRVDASAALVTLTDYIRDGHGYLAGQRLTGTKVACAEGDCGACTVLVSEPTRDDAPPRYKSVDACIAFVFQMDGRQVVTVEGLGGTENLSTVQAAMVDGHGSQCGFCTPGFVMALHGVLEESVHEGCSQRLTDHELRLGLSGNLCRCTGYRQILDAAQALEPATTTSIAQRFESPAIRDDLDALGSESVEVVDVVESARIVAIPRSLDDLLAARKKYPNARLIAGATDLGVQYNHGRFIPRQVIYTGQVAELAHVEVLGDELVIGAAATWDQVEAFAHHRLPEYHQILTRFGSPQVRHAGTVAGNLANASPIADSIPMHYVTESTLELARVGGTRQVDIRDFYLGYKQVDLQPDEVITRVRTPLPPHDVVLKLYKVSKRRDMDISTVTAAIWLRQSQGKVLEARVAAGGVGPTVVRLPRVEKSLVGSAITLQTMRRAGQIAREEVQPISDVRGSGEYRLQLVENLFAKCYYDLTNLSTTLGA